VPQVFELLERHRVALCLHDKEGSAVDAPWIGPFAYVRFHGPSGRYHGSYSDAVLERWSARLAERWRNGVDVYAYFNNDPNADATRNATTLARLLGARLESDGAAGEPIRSDSAGRPALPHLGRVRSTIAVPGGTRRGDPGDAHRGFS
jgi:uncharacterized protein YecE (DUF72 family)